MKAATLALCVVVASATNCRVDEYLLHDKIDGQHFCAECSPGTHTPKSAIIDKKWSCVDCETKVYSLVSEAYLCSAARGLCPAGEYNKCANDYEGCMLQCSSCPAGYFGGHEGKGHCDACPSGYF